jgi:DNA polymerase-3 subunit delta'
MNLPWLKTVEAEFAERFESGRLAHALLLTGPAGTGKQQLALDWVASLLCLENRIPACGRCRSCQLFISGAHPDYRLLTFEANEKNGNLRTEIVIGQVRSLIASLQLTTTISERKAAMIYPAEALNRNAANALLKTLEEPPGNTVILLVSDDPGRLTATIRSRCQNLLVRLPDRTIALDWLIGSGKCQAADAEAALSAAAGSPLKAREMLEDGSTGQYRQLRSTLARVHECGAGSAMGELGEIDPERLWVWLSLVAAEKLRLHLDNRAMAKQLSGLQSLADKNRYLLPSPVRKDFLLQDWLIQWAELNV